jgi:hypothetical protein
VKARLTTALGAVREGAQAVDNLTHLLRARRVGPRAITVALGEVREICLGLGAALAALEGELCLRLSGAPEAVGLARLLFSEGEACAARVASQLDVKGPTDARGRLALEELARRSVVVLEGVIFLAELLAAAASSKAVPLDMGDALHEIASPTAKGGPARMKVSVGLSGSRSFVGDARVVSGLLLLAIGRVARAGLPSIAVTGSPGGAVEVRVAADFVGARIEGAPGVERLALDMPLQGEIPLAGDVLGAAAALAGVEVSVSEEPLSIALVFGKAGP